MDEHKKPTIGFWFTVVAAALVPLAMYVGAYLVLVEPRTYAIGGSAGYDFFTVANYRWPGSDETIDSEFVATIFSPVNALDRRVRIKTWEPLAVLGQGRKTPLPR